MSDSPGTGIKDGSQLPCGCWGPNPGPLQEQSVLLTARPSLQPHNFSLSKILLEIALDSEAVVRNRRDPINMYMGSN